MKSFVRRSAIGCFMLVFVLNGSQAMAWRGHGEGSKEKWEEKREIFARELGLSQEQKDELSARKEAARVEREAAREEMKAAEGALREALKMPETDIALVNSAALRVKTAQGVQVDQRVQSFLSMKEVLTPEQFRKMLEMKVSTNGVRPKS